MIHNRYRQRGGEDTVVDSQRALLAAAGHHVDSYTASNGIGLRGVGQFGVAVWNAQSRKRARVALRDFDPDLVHIHNTWFALTPSVVREAAAHPAPVVMTLHNFRLLCVNAQLLREGGPCEKCVGTHPWHGVRHRCYRGSAALSTVAAANIAFHRAIATWQNSIDLFICLTEFARDRFVDGGLPSRRMAVVSNFVEDPGGRVDPPSRSPTVLFVGRIDRSKGIFELLAAWLRAKPANLELVVVGDGPELARAQHLAKDEASIHFAGALEHPAVLDRLACARALVLPSLWYEGQPLVLLEALAAGLPIIGTRLGGIAETLRPLGARWLRRPGDAQDWAEALADLASDESLDEAGKQARCLYERRYTPEIALRQLEDAYCLAGALPREAGLSPRVSS